MTITKEEIEAVLAGCDGVTPEPWAVYHFSPEVVREIAALALEALSSREAGWQPIETFPRDHFPMLVYGPHGQLVAFLDVTWAWWPCPAMEALSYIPTHWRPLPTPPDQGSK